MINRSRSEIFKDAHLENKTWAIRNSFGTDVVISPLALPTSFAVWVVSGRLGSLVSEFHNRGNMGTRGFWARVILRSDLRLRYQNFGYRMQMAILFFNFGPSGEIISRLEEGHRYSPIMRRVFAEIALCANFAPTEIRNDRSHYGIRYYPVI